MQDPRKTPSGSSDFSKSAPYNLNEGERGSGKNTDIYLNPKKGTHNGKAYHESEKKKSRVLATPFRASAKAWDNVRSRFS